MQTGNAVELPSGRDRAFLFAGLAALTAVAAAYFLFGIGMEMSAIERTLRVGAPGPAPGKTGVLAFGPGPLAWTPGEFGSVFLTWWSMTAAMMLPTLGPISLAHAALRRRIEPGAGTLAGSGLFVAGFLSVWGGFSVAATLAQWALEQHGMLSPTGLVVTHNILSGAILVAAGLYQFSRIKGVCLGHCRHPRRCMPAVFRPGIGGAFQVGALYGTCCIGGFGFLMTILFFGGVANLYCIGGIAALVLIEKLVPRGDSIGLGVGSVLILWGVLFLVSATGIL